MPAHLALATALLLAAAHLAPPLPDSPEGAVILTTPDTKANEPGRCPSAGDQPAYRDLSDTTLIPVTPRIPLENHDSPL